jgi:bile acid:Na+ symporter, BASS family
MTWFPTATLFAMMLGLGMTLHADDFRRLLRSPRAVGFGLIAQLVGLPMIAFAIASALAPSPALAIGLVLVAACPGGVTSNVICYLARGDVALSVTLTALSSVVSFLTVPFLTALAIRSFGGDGATVELGAAEMMATLFGTTATPVLLGMMCLYLRPALASRVRGYLITASTVLLVLLIVGLTARSFESEHDMASLALRATPMVALLIVVASIAGAAGGRALGLSEAMVRTLALEVGIQNVNLALVVAITLLDAPSYAGATLVYLPLMGLFATALVVLGRRTAPMREATSPLSV